MSISLDRLNPAQQEAVQTSAKHHLIVAGAGAGKTTVLLYKIAWELQQSGILPERLLAVSYTRKAAQIMQERLVRDFGITVEIRTFHSFAYHTVKECTGKTPKVMNQDVHEFVHTNFSEFLKDRHFLKVFYEHLLRSDEIQDNNKKSALKKNYLTLSGKDVSSLSEKRLADFLLLHEIPYSHHIETYGSGALPAHFPINNRNIFLIPDPPRESRYIPFWFSAERRKHRRLQRLAADKGAECRIVHSSDLNSSDFPEIILKFIHEIYGECTEKNPDQLHKLIYDYAPRTEAFKDLLCAFIQNARSCGLEPDNFTGIEQKYGIETAVFTSCAVSAMKKFMEEMLCRGEIDFPGLIHQALDCMHKDAKRFAEMYDMVLVDEFQDISQEKIDLLKLLVTPENTARLFCVGDDWQSIYSFSGSQVRFFTRFAEHFPDPHNTYLTVNYRCPVSVLCAGETLMSFNIEKIQKKMKGMSRVSTHPRLHILPEMHFKAYRIFMIDYTVKVITHFINKLHFKPEEILVLCRYKLFFPELMAKLSSAGIVCEQENKKGVRLYSIHKAKGDEADAVILLHAAEGMWGFPAVSDGPTLLRPVRLLDHEELLEEERRLCYVALTRAKKELHIFTMKGSESLFITEIKRHCRKFMNAHKFYNRNWD